MKNVLLLFLLVCQVFQGFSQEISKITNLNDGISETSGLLYFNNSLLTHNDSGGMNAVYEINLDNGNIIRTVTIQNANNVDWEDICQDENYIYIGDFGNNSGSRTDLRIYKVAKTDFLNADAVNAEVIEFSYQDQIDFTPASNNNNFDAETLISFGDDLYIFTKNWVDQRTNIYKVSKVPGTYQIARSDEFDAEGLVTGGTFNPLDNKVVLSGYAGLNAFVIELTGFSGGKFSNGSMNKYNLSIPLTESFQAEGIDYRDASNYFISTEKNTLGSAALYSLLSSTLSIDDFDLVTHQVYPNPGRETLKIDGTFDLDKIEVFDYLGKMVFQDNRVNMEVDISAFPNGVYILKLYSGKGATSLKFIKQ